LVPCTLDQSVRYFRDRFIKNTGKFNHKTDVTKMNRRKQTATKKKTSASSTRSKSKSPTPAARSKSSKSSTTPAALQSSGYLLTCDPPTKQKIKHLDELKSIDKKFILEDLDATHLLIKEKARDEIFKEIENWMNQNVWSNIERVGENLET